MKNILIIEKSSQAKDLLLSLLKEKKISSVSVEKVADCFSYLEKQQFDLIFADAESIQKLSHIPKLPPVVLIKEQNVSPPNFPLFGLINKPVSPQKIETVLSKVTKKPLLIAESPAMKNILDTVIKIAPTSANVFISGESGTGKEVIASLIHSYSKRAPFPFIKVNCAAVPDTLIESEFFGHEKGSFTGATETRIGRFELADKGTLLLDEVTEIPLELQAKLLRVCQEQELERVGSSKLLKVNVRLISTSNRDLLESIESASFREDLYYRLHVVEIHIPPLRERLEDILPLAYHFLKESSKKNSLPLKTLSEKAEEKLLLYDWPGNIRQLSNVIEQSVILSEGDLIEEKEISLPHSSKPPPASSLESAITLPLKDVERMHIEKTLKKYKNNKTQAANALKISIRTLRNKLNSYLSEDEA